MKKKIIAVMMSVTLTMALTVSAFAASSSDTEHHKSSSSASASSASSTTSVATTPVSATGTQVAARDYGAAVTPAMSEAAATTPAQAVVLSQTVAVAPVALSNGAALAATPADPSVIALAKLDILLNQSVQSELAKQGIGGTNGIANILGAGTLSASDGRAIKNQTISLDALGITSANGVAFLVYVPDANGVMQPRVIKPRFRKGKLQVSLPVPCEYNVIQNVALPAAAN